MIDPMSFLGGGGGGIGLGDTSAADSWANFSTGPFGTSGNGGAPAWGSVSVPMLAVVGLLVLVLVMRR